MLAQAAKSKRYRGTCLSLCPPPSPLRCLCVPVFVHVCVTLCENGDKLFHITLYKGKSFRKAKLLTMAKRWKQPNCPLVDEWINKMWSHHTMGYYSACKWKEILTPATIHMNLEDIMPSEISQAQRMNSTGLHLHEVPTESHS